MTLETIVTVALTIVFIVAFWFVTVSVLFFINEVPAQLKRIADALEKEKTQ